MIFIFLHYAVWHVLLDYRFVSPLGPVLYQHVRRTSLVDMERIAVEMPAVLIDVFNAGENRIGYFELRTTARHFFAASFRFRTSTFLRNSLSFFWSIFAAEVEPKKASAYSGVDDFSAVRPFTEFRNAFMAPPTA